MDDYMIINGELYHHGVKGMKWGVRKKQNSYATRNIRGHAGPGIYYGSDKRKLAKAKGDLERLNKGEHLSVGMTKKRQAEYDARDKAALEKKISKLEGNIRRKADKKAVKKSNNDVFYDRYDEYLRTKLKDVKEDLDKPYRQAIGNGIYANWPSKRSYIEAEIDRISRDRREGKKFTMYDENGSKFTVV